VIAHPITVTSTSHRMAGHASGPSKRPSSYRI
jgi:hypothetical protein